MAHVSVAVGQNAKQGRIVRLAAPCSLHANSVVGVIVCAVFGVFGVMTFAKQTVKCNL